MLYVVGKPVAGMLAALTGFLDGMGTSNAILLGLLLGGMMCVDLGGPVNKAAYAFSVGLLSSHSYAPMAAVMAAGMVPPIGMGLATLLARRKFAESERQAGKAASVLGLCFISEGAIPFAAKDPLRVIPASIAGGALTGALSMYFGCKLQAPHGGLFVMLVPNAINHALAYLLAIVAGSLLTGLLYAVLKRGAEPDWRWGPRPRGSRRLADNREAVMGPTPPERRGRGRANNAAGVIRRDSENRRITASGYSPQRSIRPGAASGLAQQAHAIFLCEAGLVDRQRAGLPASHRVVVEAVAGHALGVVEVAPVEDHRGLQALLEQLEIRCLELLPLGADDQRIGASQGRLGVPIRLRRSSWP